MTHPPPSADDQRALRALISWWAQAGVTLLEEPRRERRSPAPAPQKQAAPVRERPERPQRAAPMPERQAPTQAAAAPRPSSTHDEATDQARLVQSARAQASKASSLEELKTALEGFTAHPLHALARNTVFARGRPDAPIMVIGEAPGRDEDRIGQPFVGRSGQLLDRMFAAIGLSAEAEEASNGLYISNIVNWRPPGNRNPSADEIALCLPFIERHIALVRPRLVILTGGVSAQSLLQTRQGIMKLRGRWTRYALASEALMDEIPALPIYHPAFVLRRPIAKREVWADLLSVREKLDALT